MKLSSLTRENWDSPRAKIKRKAKAVSPFITLYILTVLGLGLLIYQKAEENRQLKNTLSQIIFEHGMKGCPVLTEGRTNIVISAETTLDARNALGKIANDLDDFHAAINKAERIKLK